MAAAGQKKVNRIVTRWAGGKTFDAGRPAGPMFRVDTSGQTGPGPVDVLLCALATCSAIDVVEILQKRRTPVESLEIDVTGVRVAAIPARLEHVVMRYTITGEGIEAVHAVRAIDLAVNKYCSVKDSLDPDLPVELQLELNGERVEFGAAAEEGAEA
jgi:putative redox protein